MARLARIVAPGCPHHVTARGNRREPIFFEDGDHDLYLDILAEHMAEAQVAVWAYCLMPNHVHLSSARKRRRAWGEPWARRIDGGPTSSTPAAGGGVTCSTGASPRWRWMKIIC